VTIPTAQLSFLRQVVGTPFQRGLHLLMNPYMLLTNFWSPLLILERTFLATAEMDFLAAGFLWLLRCFLAFAYPFLWCLYLL